MKTLITEAEIQSAISELAKIIERDYRERPLTVLGVLTGSVILLADLIRCIDLPLRVGLLQASSYRGKATTPGRLEVNIDFVPDIADRDVLLLDDILDTGQTLNRLVEQVKTLKPRSLRTAVLLWKNERTVEDIKPDHFCFQIPDTFVVGYGLDYDDQFRNLPYIAALEDTDLTATETSISR